MRTHAAGPAADAPPGDEGKLLRAGAADIGSKGIRFLAAEIGAEGLLRPLEARRAPVHLGHGVFLTGRLTEGSMEAALSLGRRYLFDEGHGVQVARLAASLFDQLRPLHGMGDGERRLLVAAGLLHDVGQLISFKRHHKHSLRLLAHAELPGFSPREMLLIANLARYHRKRHPHPDHPEYAALPPVDRDRVRRLAAILRLADAMDREHMQRVRLVRVRPQGDELALMIEGEGDLLLEKWALKKKSGLFSEVYGRRVRIGN